MKTDNNLKIEETLMISFCFIRMLSVDLYPELLTQLNL